MKRFFVFAVALLMLFASGCASSERSRNDSGSGYKFSVDAGTDAPAASSYAAVRKPYFYDPEALFPASAAESVLSVWITDANGHVVKCSNQSKLSYYEYNNEGFVSTQTRYSLMLKDPNTGDHLKQGTFDYQYRYTDSGKPLVMTRTYTGRSGAELESGDITTFTYQYDGDTLISVDEIKTRKNRQIQATHYTISCNADGQISAIRWYIDDWDFRYYVLFYYENGDLKQTVNGSRELPDTSEAGVTVVDYRNGEPVRVTSGDYSISFEYDAIGSVIKVNDQSLPPLAVDSKGNVIGN